MFRKIDKHPERVGYEKKRLHMPNKEMVHQASSEKYLKKEEKIVILNQPSLKSCARLVLHVVMEIN